MCSSTNGAPRRKVQRTVKVVQPATPTNSCVGIMITEGRKQDSYLVMPIPADFGLGFVVEKITREAEKTLYYVLLEHEGSSCDCHGFLRWGHCRHVEVLPVLMAHGHLQSSWPQDYAAWSDQVDAAAPLRECPF
jgi:hypothetical protein